MQAFNVARCVRELVAYCRPLYPSWDDALCRTLQEELDLTSQGPLRTLSFIALRQPVPQAHVVRVRGKLAYGHVKQLRQMDLITDDRVGRTRILKTTATFADYFNLPHDTAAMKREIKNVLDVKGENLVGLTAAEEALGAEKTPE